MTVFFMWAGDRPSPGAIPIEGKGIVFFACFLAGQVLCRKLFRTPQEHLPYERSIRRWLLAICYSNLTIVLGILLGSSYLGWSLKTSIGLFSINLLTSLGCLIALKHHLAATSASASKGP